MSKSEKLKPLSLKVAAFLFLIASSIAVLLYVSKDEPSIYKTAGQTETVTLPDGSRIALNRNSELSLDAGFGDKNRMVTLSGEAFFEVTPGGRHPFVIKAGNARLQVIGTSFNVNAYDSLDEVEVIVETGIVRVEPLRGRQGTDVLPGEKGVVEKKDSRMSISVNEDLNFQSWNTQHLVFIEENLPSVIRTLEKTFHARISVNSDVAQSCIVTATFDKQSLASVLRELEKTLDLTYTVQGNHIQITGAGC